MVTGGGEGGGGYHGCCGVHMSTVLDKIPVMADSDIDPLVPTSSDTTPEQRAMYYFLVTFPGSRLGLGGILVYLRTTEVR